MRLPHVRVTIRSMMVIVALVALNLTTVSATRRVWPSRLHSGGIGIGNGRGYTAYHADGSIWVAKGNAETGYRDDRMVRPPRPSIVRVCSPVVAGLTITLFILIYMSNRPRSRVARGLILVLLLSMSMVALHWWWVLYGGNLPVNQLRLDMTKQEVRAIVGPPDPAGSTDDLWLITRSGSLCWMTIEFDHDGLLRAYPPGSHQGGSLRAYHRTGRY